MNDSADSHAYHHGTLRAAAIAATVAEVEAVGISAASMRGIARRAGVTHAAVAHHFADKTGLFTAVAAEGFRRMASAIRPAAAGDRGFLAGGMEYVRFALENRGFYEVAFRPSLCDHTDPEFKAARDEAFDVLYASARCSLVGTDFCESDVASLVIAGWSMSHGFATLATTGNFADRARGDILRGVTLLASLLDRDKTSSSTTAP